MVSCEEVKNTIENHLKGSKVIVSNPRGDNVHFAVDVEYEGFKRKSLIQQHKMVYSAFNNNFNECGQPLHALQIKTKVKNG